MIATPLNDEQLLARCDLAGIARVLSEDGAHATLRFTKLLKGRPPGGLLTRIGFRRDATVRLRGLTMIDAGGPDLIPALGGWTDQGAYRPGSLVKTHLVWDATEEVYLTAWWNAVTRPR